MSVATPTAGSRLDRLLAAAEDGYPPRVSPLLERVHFAGAFAATATVYLTTVVPLVRGEVAHARAAAREIPNERLRLAALASLEKRGNIEGAALFATLAARDSRRDSARALARFQALYNYVDALSELPCPDAQANARQSHQALLVALEPGATHPDYYQHSRAREDGGYLQTLVERCWDALAALPSFPIVAVRARRAAARIVEFQALNLAEIDGGHAALERRARDACAAQPELQWWEAAAAAGSSLAVHVLIAAAARPELDEHTARELELAYFPRVGALHSLLDSLADRLEDAGEGRRSLLDYYGSPLHAASRLEGLAVAARAAVESLPDAHTHRMILTGMCSYYLSAEACRTPEGEQVAKALTAVFGPALAFALALFRTRRLAALLTGTRYV